MVVVQKNGFFREINEKYLSDFLGSGWSRSSYKEWEEAKREAMASRRWAPSYLEEMSMVAADHYWNDTGNW